MGLRLDPSLQQPLTPWDETRKAPYRPPGRQQVRGFDGKIIPRKLLNLRR